MIKARVKNFAVAVLALLSIVCLCFGIAGFSDKSSTVYAAGEFVVFDGAKDTALPTTSTDATTGASYEVVQMSKIQSGKAGCRAYAINTGGSTDSTRRYVKMVVPTGHTAEIILTGYSNSNTSTRYLFVATSPTKDTNSAISGSLLTSSTTTETTVRVTVEPGTYYVCANGSANISYLSMIVKPDGANVIYDANGGATEVPSDDTLYAIGASATVSAITPTVKEGFAFTGWNTKADGTGDSYAPGATIAGLSQDVTLYAQYNVSIKSIVSPEPITVIKGDVLIVNSLGLPDTVKGVDYADKEIELSVEWNTTDVESKITAEGLPEGDYTINGTVIGTVKNPVSSELSSITVKVTSIGSKYIIASLAGFEEQTVYVNDAIDSVSLPETVEATLSTGEKVTLELGEWDIATFDTTSQTTTPIVLTNTAIYNPALYSISCSMDVELKVNVAARKILSAEDEKAYFAVGTNLTGVTVLPATVFVMVQGVAEAVEIPVVWDATELGGVNTVSAADYVINGTLNLDGIAEYVNTDSVTVKGYVSVVELASVEWRAYADQANPVEYGKNWTEGLEGDVIVSGSRVVISKLADASSDTAHDQTAPMIKIGKDKTGIRIEIPEGASSVKITVSAVTYSGKEATLTINQDSVAVGTGSVTANSNTAAADTANAFQSFVASDVTTTGEIKPGIVTVSVAGQNTYVTGVKVEGAFPETFTLSYNAGEGSDAPKATEYDKNASATVGKATAPTGYEFIGWATSSDGETAYHFNDSIVMTENVTLFAVYKPLITEVTADFDDFIILSATAQEGLLNNTKEVVYGIPSAISAKLADGQDVELSISFSPDQPTIDALNGATVGKYVLSGSIAGGEYNFADGVNTSVSYTIVILEKKSVIRSCVVNGCSMEVGAELPKLPETVPATVEGVSGNVELGVLWNTENVNVNAAGNYTAIGSLVYDETIMEVDPSLVVSMNIEVYNYTITGAEPISDIIIYKGSSKALPTTVVVNYTDKLGLPKTTTLEAGEWVCDTFDANVPGDYTFTANVIGTSLYVADGISASVKVTVKDYAPASTARSTNFVDSAKNIVAGTFRGFTISGQDIAYADSRGFKGKNLQVSFTLSATATVKIAYYHDPAKNLTVTFANTDSTVNDTLVGGNNEYVKELSAGTYTLSSLATSASMHVKYIIIEDGSSEIFIAKSNEASVKAPSIVNEKTVNGITYKFYGYTEGTNVYQPGEDVAASEEGIVYYAIYANASANKSASIKVAGTERVMRFKSKLDLLNADVIFDSLSTAGKINFTRTVKDSANETADVSSVVTATPSVVGDEVRYNVYVNVADSLATKYSVSTALTIAGNELLKPSEDVFTISSAYVATKYLETGDVAEGNFKFETEDGKFCAYNTVEREFIAGYVPADYDVTAE